MTNFNLARREWLSMLDWARDSRWAFAAGLALLSFPVTAWHFAAWDSRSIGQLDWQIWWPAICGSIGMFVAGAVAYHATRRSTVFLERAALLTLVSFGMAFLVAMVPAPQAWSILIVPMAMAWAGGVSIVGVPSFVLLAGWSIFYLALFGPKWSVGERHSIIRADVSTFCWIFAWLALSIATLIFALWVRV